MFKEVMLSLTTFMVFLTIAPTSANDCTAPDNGSLTIDLPASCPYTADGKPFLITGGLPPGTTIELDPTIDSYINIVRNPGGNLGGEIIEFDALLTLKVIGTGLLGGFSRTLFMPVKIEYHTAPRNPGDADGGGDVNIGDATFIVKYVFQGGDAPPCLDQANADGGTDVNIGDATYIVKYVFQSGDFPVCGTTGS